MSITIKLTYCLQEWSLYGTRLQLYLYYFSTVCASMYHETIIINISLYTG